MYHPSATVVNRSVVVALAVSIIITVAIVAIVILTMHLLWSTVWSTSGSSSRERQSEKERVHFLTELYEWYFMHVSWSLENKPIPCAVAKLIKRSQCLLDCISAYSVSFVITFSSFCWMSIYIRCTVFVLSLVGVHSHVCWWSLTSVILLLLLFVFATLLRKPSVFLRSKLPTSSNLPMVFIVSLSQF